MAKRRLGVTPANTVPLAPNQSWRCESSLPGERLVRLLSGSSMSATRWGTGGVQRRPLGFQKMGSSPMRKQASRQAMVPPRNTRARPPESWCRPTADRPNHGDEIGIDCSEPNKRTGQDWSSSLHVSTRAVNLSSQGSCKGRPRVTARTRVRSSFLWQTFTTLNTMQSTKRRWIKQCGCRKQLNRRFRREGKRGQHLAILAKPTAWFD